MKINQKIKKLRNTHNLSQEKFGKKLNLSRQTISKWENEKSSPDLETIILISNIFEISLEELIGQKISEIQEETKNMIMERNKRKERKEMLTTQAKRFFYIVGSLLIICAGVGIYRIYQTYNYKINLYGIKSYTTEVFTEKSGIEQEYLSTVTLTDGTVIENFTISDLENYDLINKNNKLKGKKKEPSRVFPTQIVNFYLNK